MYPSATLSTVIDQQTHTHNLIYLHVNPSLCRPEQEFLELATEKGQADTWVRTKGGHGRAARFYTR